MNPYSSARDEYKDIHDEMVFLDANENPFKSAVNRYPDPAKRLSFAHHPFQARPARR